jgi:hypothetical protein
LKKDAEAIEVKIDNGRNTIVEYIVRFDKDELLLQYCKSIGLVPITGQAEVIFLLRREYHAVWDEIKTQLKAITGENQFVVTGTAGIGKSAFRFFVLRQWLLDFDELDYRSVVFDDFGGYHRVDKAGKVCTFEPDLDIDLESIFVLNPCRLVGKVKHLPYGLTIITSSPTPIQYRNNHQYSIRDFRCDIFVMKAWTEGEILSISPNLDMSRYRKFSYVNGGERLCIPKWLAYTDAEADSQVESCRDLTSLNALKVFLKTTEAHARDIFMPYALCVIEYVPRYGWQATGFVSDFVAKSIHKWVNAHSVMDKSSIIELLRNPFSHSLLGGIFKDWVETALGTEGKVLRVSDRTYDLDFTFSGILSYAWRRGTSEKLQLPQVQAVQLKNKVYYTPEDVDSSLIDGYAISDDFLLLVYTTVAMSHCGVQLLAVQDIITAAQAANQNMILCMVYVVPQAHASTFRPPACDELIGVGASVCVGVITDEDALMARYARELS